MSELLYTTEQILTQKWIGKTNMFFSEENVQNDNRVELISSDSNLLDIAKLQIHSIIFRCKT